MRSILIALYLVLVSTMAFSQQASSLANGGIFGLVSDRAARLVASAPIEARNVDTNVRFHVDSSATGEYRLSGLPAGDYELSISITGVGNFVQKRVTVTSAAPVRFDIIVPLG